MRTKILTHLLTAASPALLQAQGGRLTPPSGVPALAFVIVIAAAALWLIVARREVHA